MRAPTDISEDIEVTDVPAGAKPRLPTRVEEAQTPALESPNEPEGLEDYYREASRDYSAWSDKLNMHFGYSRWGFDVFDRETMLDQMTDEVHRRLDLDDEPGETVADLGCGVGAALRHGAERHDAASWHGVTISDWQVRRGRRENRRHTEGDRVVIRHADYRETPFDDDDATAAYAIESACHASGPDKAGLVDEAARILEPGGRFVVADVLRTDGGEPLGRFKKWAYDTMCECWAVDELAERDAFVATLEAHGFEDVEVEDVSWNVAPCALHVPFVTLKFLWACWRDGDALEGWRRAHVLGSVLSMIVGMCRSNFSYCIVTARYAPEPDEGE